MAKKTKKEKILAELHREKQKLAVQINQSSNRMEYQISTPVEKKPLNVQNQSVTASTNIDYSYVLRDLSRTLILTALAICAQLCVYYFLEIKHISLFKF